jgi:hypothetical protein
MTLPLRTHILSVGLLWSALLLAAPTAVNAGQILGAPTYIGLNSGLAAFWSFDGKDTAGNVAYDRSGQANNGTLMNGPARTVGKIGQALEFDQINDYVDLNKMDVSGSAMTISAWVYRRAVPSTADCWTNDDCRIIDKSIGTGEQNIYWMLSTIWDGSKAVLRARLSTSGTTDTLIASSGEVKDGEWTHAVMRYDGATLKIYKDGVEVGSMAKTGPIDTSASVDTFIGASAVESLFWWGKIDDVRVYKRALSADEIKRLHKIGSTEKFGAPNSTGSLAQGLVAWWTMDGADTSLNNSSARTALDRAGNRYHAKSASAAVSPQGAVGKIGQALEFDGSSDNMLAAAASLGQTTSRTISAWIYPESFGPNIMGGILERVGGEIEWGFGLDDTNTTDGLTFFQNCTTPMQVFAANTITLNKWQHVLVTYTGGCANTSVTFYVDGVAKTRSGASGSGSPTSDNGPSFEISSDSSDQFYFDGRIDDIRLYNRVLTADEIKRLHKMGATLKQGVATSNGSLSSGLVGWWTFDGKDTFSNNKTADRSGNNNTGTLTNGPVRSIGKIGQALEFDGTNDYVHLGNTASLGLTGSMSVSAWVYAHTYPGASDNMIISKNINGEPERGWELNATLDNELETMAFKVSSDGNDEITVYGATELTTGRWYHMIGVYNASAQTMNLYLDGALDTDFVTGTVPSSQANSPANVHIGSRSDSQKFWDGLIDDVRVYNRALTADEIKRLYNMGR